MTYLAVLLDAKRVLKMLFDTIPTGGLNIILYIEVKVEQASKVVIEFSQSLQTHVGAAFKSYHFVIVLASLIIVQNFSIRHH